MILPRERIEAILAGTAFQRRILDAPGMYGWVCGHLDQDHLVLQYSDLWTEGKTGNRCIYQRGLLYPLSTGYGEPVLGHIELTCIYRQDVRDITGANAKTEGYPDKIEFLTAWVQEHDPSMNAEMWQVSRMPEAVDHCPVFLRYRPDDFYRAWVLVFRLPEKEAHGEQS